MNISMRNIILQILKQMHDIKLGGKTALCKQESTYVPAVGEICFGDMRRLKPFADDYGFKRGGPVDRYYINKFLEKNTFDIRDHVLEIKDDGYTKRFGGDRVKHRDILDIDPNNRLATVIADLTKADNVPSNTYDCVILTQVLQFIYDLKAAIRTAHRILKPRGVLLITAPGITRINYKKSGRAWYWSFTEASMQKLLEEVFLRDHIKTEIHGNVLVAASFLYGVGVSELKNEEYDYADPDYQIIITAKAVKEKE